MSPLRSTTAVVARHRTVGGGGGGNPTFVSTTSWPRPTPATPTAAQAAGWRLVPFTTKAGLDAAISGMQPKDYIYYSGTGVLTISASGSNAYTISNKNPSSAVVIDFGVSRSIWNTALQQGNYVAFNCTSTSNLHGLYLSGSNSNLYIYGGDYTSSGGCGIYAVGSGLTNCYIWDFYCHDTHNHGLFLAPSTSSSTVTGCNIRGECTAWAGGQSSPSWDSHCAAGECGTGIHACLLADVGNAGAFQNNTITIYAHDGASGDAIEFGQSGGGPISGNTIYVRGDNLTHVSTHQNAGCVLELWGTVSLSNNTVGWAEGNNIQGRVIDSSAGSSIVGSLLVKHGRAHNTNLNSAYFGTAAYQTGDSITYQDCILD